MSEEKIKYVCNDCGSDDIRKDAWGIWDIEIQGWELDTTYDNYHCENCEGECGVTEVII